MANPTHNQFVQNMLQSAKEKKEVKPQTRVEGVDKDEVKRFTENLQERIQKGRK